MPSAISAGSQLFVGSSWLNRVSIIKVVVLYFCNNLLQNPTLGNKKAPDSGEGGWGYDNL